MCQSSHITEMLATILFAFVREVNEIDQELFTLTTSKNSSVIIKQTNGLRETT